MIQFQTLKPGFRGNYRLLIDGTVYRYQQKQFEEGFSVHELDEGVAITLEKEELVQAFLRHRFSDLPGSFRLVKIGRSFDFVHHPLIADYLTIEQNNAAFRLRLLVGFSAIDWKMPWSFSEYLEELFEIVVERYSTTAISDDAIAPTKRSLVLNVKVITKNIGDEIETFRRILWETHPDAERNLSARAQPGSIVMSFDFPAEVKVACEQYLLYFAQFLRDLGVEAETALTHEAGQALFTVTPARQKSRIR